MSKAVTFIELLIVCAIILALVSFSTPLFRKTLTDLELKEAASNISKFITYAQQQAVINRNNYKLSFDFENKTYRLEALTTITDGEGGPGEEKYVPVQGRFGRGPNLPSGVSIEGRASEIFFYPDGRCDDGRGEQVELELTTKNNKVIKIATTGLLGNVIVTEEKE